MNDNQILTEYFEDLSDDLYPDQFEELHFDESDFSFEDEPESLTLAEEPLSFDEDVFEEEPVAETPAFAENTVESVPEILEEVNFSEEGEAPEVATNDDDYLPGSSVPLEKEPEPEPKETN